MIVGERPIKGTLVAGLFDCAPLLSLDVGFAMAILCGGADLLHDAPCRIANVVAAMCFLEFATGEEMVAVGVDALSTEAHGRGLGGRELSRRCLGSDRLRATRGRDMWFWRRPGMA